METDVLTLKYVVVEAYTLIFQGMSYHKMPSNKGISKVRVARKHRPDLQWM